MVKPNKKIVVPIILLVVGAIAIKTFLLKSNFQYAGTIEATKVDIPARVSSVISTLTVKEGDKIQAGQTLLTLSGEDYILAAELANNNHSRAEQLFKAGSISKEDYDGVKNKKDDADLKVAWCNVKSPLTGTVLTKYHEIGEMVTPGTKLFTLADIKDIYAYIYVPQRKVATLRLQQKVNGTLPEMKGRIFEGSITWIADEAEFTPKNVQTEAERTRLVYAVKVAFKNDDETLKPGMTIEVTLPAERERK